MPKMFITCLFCGKIIPNKSEAIQQHWIECPNKYLENDKLTPKPDDGAGGDRQGSGSV